MQGFDEEAFGRLGIPCWTQEKLEGVTFRVDGPVKIHPGFANLGIRFIHFPGVIAGFQMRPTSFVQFRSIPLHPAVDGGCDRRAIHVPASFLPGRDS
jgi:hypothetical protein